MMSDPLVRLPGSTRLGVPGATLVGKSDESALVDVTVVFKRKQPLDASLSKYSEKPSPQRSSAELAAITSQYGADAEAVSKFKTYARKNKLTIVAEDLDRRVVEVRGTVKAMEQTFGTSLHDFVKDNARFRGRQGPVFLPPEIAANIEAVLGLDNRPVARPQVARPKTAVNMVYPNEIANLYAFPATTGNGQTIALIELGGAYDAAELQTYFTAANVPMPNIKAVYIAPRVAVAYGSDPNSDGEVMLDVWT